MDSQELLGLTGSISFGTVLLAAAAILMQRIVGDTPNELVGIRTRATKSSPEAWQLAHRIAAPVLRNTLRMALAGFAIQLVLGLSLGFSSIASALFSIILFVVVTGMLVFAALLGDRAARRLQAGS